jgi:hypothetical protein
MSLLRKQESRQITIEWIPAHSAYAQGRPCAGMTQRAINYNDGRDSHQQR